MTTPVEPPWTENPGDAVAILEAIGVKKSYTTGRTKLNVLQGIDLAVAKGEILGIVGASGSGKSTLLQILGLLDHPDEGRVLFRGKDIIGREESVQAAYRAESVGFIFQFYHLLPELSALENVMLPEMIRKSPAEWKAAETAIKKRAEELLDVVRLKDRATHHPGELSGGEKQRVAIARALMNKPEVLLCDEPTGNLDSRTSREVVDLILDLNRNLGQTFVIVTHEMSLASKANRVYRIDEGILTGSDIHEFVK